MTMHNQFNVLSIPECDLGYVPNEARQTMVNTALSTSMGFGGHNVWLISKRLEMSQVHDQLEPTK